MSFVYFSGSTEKVITKLYLSPNDQETKWKAPAKFLRMQALADYKFTHEHQLHTMPQTHILRFCGRSRNLEFTITITKPFIKELN